MRRNASLFGVLALFGAAVGLFLRIMELNTLMNYRTMLMDFSAVSVLLMAVMAAVFIGFAVLAKTWKLPDFPQKYGPVFRGVGNLTVSCVCFLALLVGAYLSLRRWKSAGSVFDLLLSVLAVLAGCGWLSLSLDAFRNRKDGCTLLAAAMPILFGGLLLVGYYKSHAPIPAVRFTMYPFLALCADVLAVHYIAGFTAPRLHPRTSVFFSGLGTVLSITALPGVQETEIRLYLAVFAVQLFTHGLRLLLPRAYTPADYAAEGNEKAPEVSSAPAPAEAAETETAEGPDSSEN